MFQEETGPGLGPVAEQRSSVLSSFARQTVIVCLSLGLAVTASLSAHAEDAGESVLMANGTTVSELATQAGQGYYSIDMKVDHDDQISLLDWTKHRSDLEKPAEKYNRRLQFGKWRRIARDGSCLDTRGLVLQRDSKARVATRQSAVGCSVVAGEWVDPYSGETFTSADDIAIDHVVPLKNAYDTGAWKWTANKRCLYFNYQKNNIHLQAVSEFENSRKGDSSPAHYMPPLRAAQCGYLKNWLKIKLAWDLDIAPDEGDAIRENLRQAGCQDADFEISQTELKTQREEIKTSAVSCEFGAPTP